MKKAFFTLIVMMFAMTAMAQENTIDEYRLVVGDTLIWQPFAQCSSISFNVSSKKVIDFKPLHFGEKVQVVALQPGVCELKATCEETVVRATIIVNETAAAPVPTEEAKLEKPATQAFPSTYQFNPPTDHFFITFTHPDDEYRETYAKIGNEEAYNNGNGIDRYWNTSTGANWFYVPDAQGWTDDVKWDFQAFGDSFFPLNAFAMEVNTEGDLSQYYTGMEQVLNIDCWTFFVELEDGNVIRYWVDPSNGCTLKRIVNRDNPSEVTVYDLNYTKWFFGPKYKKSLHDKTR